MNKKEMNSKENVQHSSVLVPFSYYKSMLPNAIQMVPFHWHQEWELNYILKGEGIVRMDDEEIRIREGDILFLQPEVLHAMETEKLLSYDTVVFRTEMFGDAKDRCYTEILFPLCTGISKLLPLTPESRDYERMRQCAEDIIRCAKENQAQSDLLMKSRLLQLLWLAGKSGCVVPSGKALQNTEIRKAIDYMDENYMEPLTIEQMAQQVHLSKSYFMQRFREFSGMGALEYLNRLRIQKVCVLLQDGRNVSDAALSCGFRNLSNFNRQFRMVAGCTPKEYCKTLKSSAFERMGKESYGSK